jgi:SAM-dependent methyltransferase
MAPDGGPRAGQREDAARREATAAGVYDWYIGGSHALPVDVEAAIANQRSYPVVATAALNNRHFLERTVHYLGGAGVTQFLDIGSGYPTVGNPAVRNVHEIAQEYAPEGRVVYVDHDQDAVDVSRGILTDHPTVTCINGDLREPDTILNHPETQTLIDFRRPVGLLLVAILHFQPDTEATAALVERYLDRLAPGSYVVISHVTNPVTERLRDIWTGSTEVYNQRVREKGLVRNIEQITQLFASARLIPPGIVPVTDWDPDTPDLPQPDHDQIADDDHARAILAGGVGRLD